MRVLVCGGRDFGDLVSLNHDRTHPLWAQREKEYTFILRTLDRLAWETREHDEDENGYWLPDWFVIEGGARGVDSVAADWATVNWCSGKEYPADWKKYGRRAGYIRNKQMLDEGKPDLVIAFPGGKGTAMMVKLAREAGVEVKEIDCINL